MGGCANSKYAVDEDMQTKKEKKPFLLKKSKTKKDTVEATPQAAPTDSVAPSSVEPVVADGQEKNTAAEQTEETNESNKAVVENEAPKAEKEDIEFIDREEAEKQKAAASASADAAEVQSNSESNDAKKEVTTYQTTVVKHTQKEGDELLQHLRDEAFRTLQGSLKQANLNQHRTATTTASSSSNQTPETSTDDSTQDLLQQIKNQVLSSLGRSNEETIVQVLDKGAYLIKESKVKSMNELEEELTNSFPDVGDLPKKVINATTGFLTAKGTEAGVILSNILANANSGIQGIMNETEKTTVKVTRTVTEQVLSGGQLKEITKIITSTEPVGSTNFDDILKNLSSDTKVVKSGTTVTSVNTSINENHETLTSETEDLEEKAEKVVNKVVHDAVEKLKDESNHVMNGNVENGIDDVEVEENIKIEEESKITTSTTKIILNGSTNGLDQVQSEFFKQGKQAAEEVVRKLVNDTVENVTNSSNLENN